MKKEFWCWLWSCSYTAIASHPHIHGFLITKTPYNLKKPPQSRRICLLFCSLSRVEFRPLRWRPKQTAEREEREAFPSSNIGCSHSLRAAFRVCEVHKVQRCLHREQFRPDLRRCLSWFSATSTCLHIWSRVKQEQGFKGTVRYSTLHPVLAIMKISAQETCTIRKILFKKK